MQRFSIIPPNFPQPQTNFHAVSAVSRAVADDLENRKAELFNEFHDVLSDQLPDRPMHGPDMTIELRADQPISPKCTTTCRQVPEHYGQAADELIDKLLKDGIIEEVPLDEISEWISPAHFVPKDGGKGVRLVTDFTRLNKYIRRPVHPFPSSNDITRRIKAGTQFFAKLDATQGYHQVPLAPDSRKYTTFLIPRGKFRYKRGPMGLASTNDCWCCLLYTSPSPRDKRQSRMPSSA